MEKFKIRLGPAGLPISLEKNRNTVEGLKLVKKLGLNAMEIEFVRSIYLSKRLAKEVGKVAKSLGIELSVHAPYFVNLLSESKKTVDASRQRIIKSLEIAEILGAKIVVVHAAYYGKLDKEEAFRKMFEITMEILEKMKKKGIENTKLTYETMAKESQFAGLEELVKLAKSIKDKNFGITVDFAHLYARNNGKINYSQIFDKIEELKVKHLHSHFSNMKYNLNKKRFIDVHIPINSHPPFKPLAKEILKRRIEITIISESPILEKDSLKMKRIFENLGYKFG
ncbi:MAG: TIM barrel protein [Candidatus Aenigmarchaeota archaeon]|nr:TIM barrel protein [Candidatus Aenigmarchaeota archaeon]